MSWSPVTGLPINFREDASGTAASDHYLKFYVSGTTTPTPMATDATGATTLAKAQFNSLGYCVNGSSAVFIPHIDRKYRVVLFPTSADADANTFANAVWDIDGITPQGGISAPRDLTEAEMIADTTLVAGDSVILSDRANSTWDISASGTANGYNVIALDNGLYATLRIKNNTLHFNAYGGSTANTAAENTTIMALLITHSQATAFEETQIAIDGGQYDFNYIDLTNTRRITFYTFGTVVISGRSAADRNFVFGTTNYDTFPSVGYADAIKFTGGRWSIGAASGTSYTYVARLEGFTSSEFNNMSFSGSVGPASGADRITTYLQYSYVNKFDNCSFSNPGAPGAGYYSYGLYLGNDNNNLNEFDTCRLVGVIGSPAEPRTVCARINGNANSMTNCDVSGAYFGVNINGSRGGKFNLYLEGCTELVTTGPAGEAGVALGNVFNGGYYEVLTNGTAFNLGTNGGSENTTIISPRVRGVSGGSNRTFIDMVSSGACYGLTIIAPDLEDIDVDITGTQRAAQSTSSLGKLEAAWLSFPATQKPSSNPNTLDDYEEADYTPTLTFATPGDLSVAYSVQVGAYTKIGRSVKYKFRMTTSTFTHTTASGNLQIALPITPRVLANVRFTGSISVGGVTKASYTQFNTIANSGSNVAVVQACGSGVAPSNVTAANMPTGGTVVLDGEIEYESA